MIYILGTVGSHGGPSKFKNLFIEHLKENKLQFKYDDEVKYKNLLDKLRYFFVDLNFLIRNKNKLKIFIVNGTSRIFIQLIAKALGISIIIRLDGYKHYELSGFNIRVIVLASIRKILVNINIRLSSCVVFQSDFIRYTYMSSHFSSIFKSKSCKTILNPCKSVNSNRLYGDKILCVEGSIGGDYSHKLLEIISKIKDTYVVGDIKYHQQINGVKYLGKLSRQELDKLFIDNWFAYIPLEPFPPCPNSLIEAINYGIPVIASNSGANPEILENSNLLFEVPFKWKDSLTNVELNEKNITEKFDSLQGNWKYYSDLSISLSKKFELSNILNEYVNFILNEK